jgi:hypothetical protein
MTDWLEETLDRDYGEAVPEGFAAGVMARVQQEQGAAEHLSTEVARGAAQHRRIGEDGNTAEHQNAGAPRGRILHFPHFMGLAAAAALLLAVGFWMGDGAKPVEPTLVDPGSTNMAALELAELYNNRDVLQDLDILSDADLELAFQDEAASTWILDETAEALEATTNQGEEQ